jgi:hypothetical protein
MFTLTRIADRDITAIPAFSAPLPQAPPIVRLAPVAAADRARLLAIGERHQEVRQIPVPVLHEAAGLQRPNGQKYALMSVRVGVRGSARPTSYERAPMTTFGIAARRFLLGAPLIILAAAIPHAEVGDAEALRGMARAEKDAGRVSWSA